MNSDGRASGRPKYPRFLPDRRVLVHGEFVPEAAVEECAIVHWWLRQKADEASPVLVSVRPRPSRIYY
jgi:hypothetical protein